MNRLYPIGIQNFESLRTGGYHYVDKTALVYRLATTGKYYFLSRPRRFGKSLLISTLEAYFQGKKELFAGLEMEKLEQEWTEYPVLHLDLNARNYENKASLIAILNQHLEVWEAMYGDEKKTRAPEERFSYLIEKISRTTQRHVVILVDEYDKPLLQAIGNEPLQTEYRNTLKAFYGVLKSCDRYIRFALLTGVTKFSKVSIFSDLNNLNDISMHAAYAPLCGITEEELYQNFADDIHQLGEANEMDEAEAARMLKRWYDGYHFAAQSPDIYNPFSLLNTFSKMRFGSYWFETGTPTFLIELLRQGNFNLYELTREQVSEDMLGEIDNRGGNPLQKALRLMNQYIENLYKVDHSFLSDLRRKVIFAEHYDEHREFWHKELSLLLDSCRKQELLLPEIDAAAFTEQLMGSLLDLRLNGTSREELSLFCRTILRGAATRQGIELIDRRA